MQEIYTSAIRLSMGLGAWGVERGAWGLGRGAECKK